MLCEPFVESHAHTLDGELWTKLLRRAQVIVTHQRFYKQRIDAREVAQRALVTHPAPKTKILQYRALLEEAVESFIHGFR